MIDMQDESYKTSKVINNGLGIALVYTENNKRKVWGWFPNDIEYSWWQYGAFERPPSEYSEEYMTKEQAEKLMFLENK